MATTQVCISSGPATDLYNLMVWDVSTGNILSTYKPPRTTTTAPVGRGCLDIISDKYLICAYHKTPIVNVWSLDRKDHLVLKMILPGAVQALAVTSDGNYCLAAIGTKIYVWQVASGRLLNILERHYQNVTHIVIAADMSFFVTGGQDGLVLIWRMSDVLSSCQAFTIIDGHSTANDPWKKLVHSSNPISAIHIGHGNAGSAKVAVTSEDNICRLYRLHSGQVLATILFGEQDVLTAVTMDLSEIYLYVGTQAGTIYKTKVAVDVKLEDNKPPSDGFIQLDVNRNPAKAHESMPKLVGHTAAITSMAVAIDGHILISGSLDATIKEWHTHSDQCMRTVTYKGPVDNVIVRPTPSGLYVNESADTNGQSSSVDPSFVTSGKNRNAQSSSFEARYIKTNSHEMSMATALNPPPPVSPFSHNLYKPAATFFSERQSLLAASDEIDRGLDPFEVGSIPVRNGPLVGGKLRPWHNFNVPSAMEIDEIHDFQNMHLFDIAPQPIVAGGSKAGKNKKKNKAAMPNGSQGEQPDNHQEEVEQFRTKLNDNDTTEELEKLASINQDLYQYSVKHFFNNLLE